MLRIILLALALLFLAIGVGTLLLFILALINGHAPSTLLGQVWYELSPSSLNGFQVLLERYLNPVLWQWMVPLLLKPIALIMPIIAVGSLVLAFGATIVKKLL